MGVEQRAALLTAPGLGLHSRIVGVIRPPQPALLVVGLLAGPRRWFDHAAELLEERFGTITLRSAWWPFTATDYYRAELGDNVHRQFLCPGELVDIEQLADIKRTTNDLEQRIGKDAGRGDGARPVNIDPGYLTPSKLVLATTKDAAHRLYLRDGIYAEITLRFTNGTWQPWPWTYPDFAATTYHGFLQTAREDLRCRLRQRRPGGSHRQAASSDRTRATEPPD